MRRFLVTTFGAAAIFSLSGCTTPNLYQDASTSVDTTQSQIQDNSKPAPSVIVNSGAYVNLKPVSLTHPPKWLSHSVTIDGRQLPFASYVQVILAGTPAVPAFDDKSLQGVYVTLHYHGTISGALQALAAKTNSAYQVDGNIVHFSQFETKTFDVAFMPGETSYLVGHTSNSSMMDSGGSSGGSSGGQTQTVGMNTTDDQYSKLTGSLSVWSDLTTTLNALKSSKGTVTVDEATTAVTVTDYPKNVAAMGEYITKLNKELSRQVMIQVEVLQVDLKSQFNYGVDWKSVQKDIITEGGTSALTLTPIGGATAASIGWTNNGNSAILRALSQQGNVSVVTSPQVMTLNNQLAEIDITNQQGYLASIQTTVTSGTGATGFSQTSLNPGEINTGFVMYLLPKIENDKVYLQLSAVISSLVSLDTFSANTGQTGVLTSQTQPNTIELPNIDYKRFNQRSAVPNGATLILAGFKQANDTANTTGLFGITPLGGRGAMKENIEMIILITPTVVGANNE